MPRREISDMTEAEVLQGISRCKRTLENQPGFRNGALGGLVLGFAAGLFGAAALFTGAAGGLMLGIAAATGAGSMFAVALTGRFVMMRADRKLGQLQAVLPRKTLVREQAEAEAARQALEAECRRKQEAAEKFNAAVDAGLPLEAPVKIGKSLQLKAPKKQRGFLNFGVFWL